MLDERRERLRTQWRLAFALREEYNEAIRSSYPGEYRLDASQLMIDATEAVSGIQEADIANMLIVDDFQDTTLAGFALLEALHERGGAPAVGWQSRRSRADVPRIISGISVQPGADAHGSEA